MRKLFTVVLASVFVLSWGLLGVAGDGGKGKKKRDVGEMFKKLDKDNDSKLSKDEFSKFSPGKDKTPDPKRLDKLFGRLDSNNDSSLSLEEFKKISEQRKKK